MGYATTGLAAMDCNDSRLGCKAVPFLANASYDASCFLERLKQILRVERENRVAGLGRSYWTSRRRRRSSGCACVSLRKHCNCNNVSIFVQIPPPRQSSSPRCVDLLPPQNLHRDFSARVVDSLRLRCKQQSCEVPLASKSSGTRLKFKMARKHLLSRSINEYEPVLRRS